MNFDCLTLSRQVGDVQQLPDEGFGLDGRDRMIRAASIQVDGVEQRVEQIALLGQGGLRQQGAHVL